MDKKKHPKPGVVAQDCNTITWKTKEGGLRYVKGKAGFHSEFQDSQGYTEKPCLKN